MDAIDALYAHLTRDRKATVRGMPDAARRDYLARAAREHRQRQKEVVAGGSPEPTAPNVRAALADAALALLATGGPGADEVRRVLGRVFAGRPGVPDTVTAKARSGRLKPRLLKSR